MRRLKLMGQSVNRRRKRWRKERQKPQVQKRLLARQEFAGPSGGTEDKPVGLVYIGCYLNGETVVKECRFHGNRMENRAQTVETALEMLKDALLKE